MISGLPGSGSFPLINLVVIGFTLKNNSTACNGCLMNSQANKKSATSISSPVSSRNSRFSQSTPGWCPEIGHSDGAVVDQKHFLINNTQTTYSHPNLVSVVTLNLARHFCVLYLKVGNL